MIFAAGLGTRLFPYTNNKPKALVCLNGICLLERAIIKLKNIGVNRIVLNVHHFADQIIDFLHTNNNFDMDIKISIEKDLLLNTGGGLKNASKLFLKDSPILLYNVDVFSNTILSDFVDQHNNSDALVSMLMRDCNDERSLYFDGNMNLAGWRNNNTQQEKIVLSKSEMKVAMGFTGIHIVNYQIFNEITEKGSFSIIDLYLRLAKTHIISAIHDKSDIWIDLGKPESLHKAEKILMKNK